jgi:hypothetical protein
VVTVPNASTLPPSLPPSPQPPQSPRAASTATAKKRGKSEFLGKGASRPMLIIGIIALVALLIFASQHYSSPGKPAVKAQAALTRSAVVITNLDDFTWPGVTLYLTGTPLDGYKAIYDQQVAPHQEISVPFVEFARGDLRFNPFERKVTQVMVWVQGHDAPMFSFR